MRSFGTFGSIILRFQLTILWQVDGCSLLTSRYRPYPMPLTTITFLLASSQLWTLAWTKVLLLTVANDDPSAAPGRPMTSQGAHQPAEAEDLRSTVLEINTLGWVPKPHLKHTQDYPHQQKHEIGATTAAFELRIKPLARRNAWTNPLDKPARAASLHEYPTDLADCTVDTPMQRVWKLVMELVRTWLTVMSVLQFVRAAAEAQLVGGAVTWTAGHHYQALFQQYTLQ